MKKFFKVLGIIFGSLIGLLIAIHIILNIVFSIQLHSKIAELKRKGRPTTIAEIIPPPVPDEENAAILYSKAFTYGEDKIGRGKLNDIVGTIMREDAMEGFVSRRKVDTFSGISNLDSKRRKEIQKLINSRNAQYIYKLLEEGSQKLKCRFDLEYEKGPAMTLPHLSSMRNSMKFLCLKALVEAEEGNIKGAFNTLLIGLKMSNHLKDEPIIISQLVRIACDTIIMECVKNISSSKGIPVEEIEMIIGELSHHTDIEPFIRCMDGERVTIGMWGFKRILRAKPRELKEDLNLLPTASMVIIALIGKPIFKRDFTCYLTVMSKIQDSFDVSYYETFEINNNEAIAKYSLSPSLFALTTSLSGSENKTYLELIEKQIPRYCIITRTLLPVVAGIRENIKKHSANVEICRTGLALKIYKIKNKTYPEKLENLVPAFLDKVPIDPFSGKNIVYNKSSSWFQIYSFGPNMRDDGGISREDKIISSRSLRHSMQSFDGRPVPQFNPVSVKDYDDYDIVWEYRE